VDHREAQLQQEIEHTRAAMTAKIDMIKAQVDEQVEGARSSIIDGMTALLEQVNRVWEVIDHVTSTVEATIEQTQETAQKPVEASLFGIDIIADLRRSPWVMIGTAILVGYAFGSGGQLFSRRGVLSDRPAPDAGPECVPSSHPPNPAWSAPTSSAAHRMSPPTSAPLREPDNPSIYKT
jgi:hypothetical protein